MANACLNTLYSHFDTLCIQILSLSSLVFFFFSADTQLGLTRLILLVASHPSEECLFTSTLVSLFNSFLSCETCTESFHICRLNVLIPLSLVTVKFNVMISICWAKERRPKKRKPHTFHFCRAGAKERKKCESETTTDDGA